MGLPNGEELELWEPRTKLGRLVKEGVIKSLSEALRSGLPLREPEIVDFLAPDLKDEVLDINAVQRMTDSGRRLKFAVTVVVGNENGIVGVGRGKAKEVNAAIRKAIKDAKLNLVEIRRGCGSWECACGRPHSIPFRVVGKSGSVVVVLKPAPRGVGLVAGDVAKAILRMAGIQDVWSFTKGHTKTTVNFAYATFDALVKTVEYRINPELASRIALYRGGAVD
ncbi:MAG: 30S ribosomal protein S5 [Thermoplasmata archaeon]|nr:MAG: 30S ribosomal protein S5 [Thermoplasmata archaeon]HDJ27293.1 30S ribosomal protein S5 [Aciduliprofundum sp.]